MKALTLRTAWSKLMASTGQEMLKSIFNHLTGIGTSINIMRVTIRLFYMSSSIMTRRFIVRMVRYRNLRNNSYRIACESLIHTVSPFYIHQWLSRVLVERLASKSSAVLQILKDTQGDWERTSFIVLARSFGLNVNGDAFEQFARS